MSSTFTNSPCAENQLPEPDRLEDIVEQTVEHQKHEQQEEHLRELRADPDWNRLAEDPFNRVEQHVTAV
jgi:hypothetical protein